MKHIESTYNYVINQLVKSGIKHEAHHFNSGAIMLDIWINDTFYVLQFDETLGLSQITDNNPGFDTIPDLLFDNDDEFKKKFDQLISS